MKVLMISKLAPWHPNAGGMENHVLQLSKNLERQNIEVIHLFWANGHKKNRGSNIKYYGIAGNELLNTFLTTQIIYIPKALFRIKKILMRENPDIIHAHGMTAGIIGIIAKKIANSPYIYTLHGISFVQYKNSTSNTLINKIIQKIANFEETKSIKKSDKIISVDKNTINLVSTNYDVQKEKFIYIPNGVNVNIFRSKNERIINKLLFVGRLEKRKGLDTLLNAISLIKKENDFIVYLIGDGVYKEDLIKKSVRLGIQSKIKFLGKISEKQLIKEYNTSSIFLLPSYSEGLPIVILEAMASKLPVIASDVGGIPEIVKNNETGLLVPPRDPRALANAMVYLLKNEKLRIKMGLAGVNMVKKYFDWKSISKKTLDVYKNVKKN